MTQWKKEATSILRQKKIYFTVSFIKTYFQDEKIRKLFKAFSESAPIVKGYCEALDDVGRFLCVSNIGDGTLQKKF